MNCGYSGLYFFLVEKMSFRKGINYFVITQKVNTFCCVQATLFNIFSYPIRML